MKRNKMNANNATLSQCIIISQHSVHGITGRIVRVQGTWYFLTVLEFITKIFILVKLHVYK